MNEPTVSQLQRELATLWPMYEALKAENAALKAELEIANRLVVANEAQARRLENELAAAQKDAERYRWTSNNLRIGKFNGWTDDSHGFQDYDDAAIDKAMEAK